MQKKKKKEKKKKNTYISFMKDTHMHILKGK